MTTSSTTVDLRESDAHSSFGVLWHSSDQVVS